MAGKGGDGKKKIRITSWLKKTSGSLPKACRDLKWPHFCQQKVTIVSGKMGEK